MTSFTSAPERSHGRRVTSNQIQGVQLGVGNQDNEEAIILEGIAQRISSKTLLNRFKEAYQTKYKYDMSGFNEPIYAVRPSIAFAFSAYGDFVGSATRWKFGNG